MKKSTTKRTPVLDAIKVFAVGSAAALMSATAGVLAYLSVRIFCGIPTVNGYLAVFAFVLAVGAAAAALAVVYLCGAWVVGKGKFSR